MISMARTRVTTQASFATAKYLEELDSCSALMTKLRCFLNVALSALMKSMSERDEILFFEKVITNHTQLERAGCTVCKQISI